MDCAAHGRQGLADDELRPRRKQLGRMSPLRRKRVDQTDPGAAPTAGADGPAFSAASPAAGLAEAELSKRSPTPACRA